MNSQIKRVIAKGKPLGVIKGLITKELLRLDKVKFDEAIKAEYDSLYPMYRQYTEEEYQTYLDDLEDGHTVLPIESLDVEIDYSRDENYVTFEEYKNETRVVQEVVYYTYEEYLTKAQEFGTPIVEESEYESIKQIKIPEATELVRPYTPIEVTDDMIQVELDKLGYIPKEKREAQKYLNDTDWYVVRYAEQGVEIPQEVLDKRQECREIL
jgi:hypothetical protein